MNRAWEQATATLAGNRRMVAVLTGVFFFLPVAALILMLPDFSQNPAFANTAGDPEATAKMIDAVLKETWWAILVASIMQMIGMLALYRLLTDRSRPTVGEALGFGAKALLPYLGATVLLALLQMLVVGLPTRLAEGTAAGPAVALFGLVVTIWLTIRFLPTGPVVAIERQFNPFRVLERSWRLTAGNALRLLVFFVLLIAACVVLWLVASLVFTLVFGLMGPAASRIGFALVTAAAMTIYFSIYVGVQIAIHRQLTTQTQPERGGEPG